MSATDSSTSMEASDTAQSKKKRERPAKSRAAQAMKDQAVEDNIKDQEEAAVATGKYVPDTDSKVAPSTMRASTSAASSVSMASGLAEATSKPDEKQLAAEVAEMRRNQAKMEAKFDSVMAMMTAIGARLPRTADMKDTIPEKERSGVQSMTISSSLSGVDAPVSIMQVGASQTMASPTTTQEARRMSDARSSVSEKRDLVDVLAAANLLAAKTPSIPVPEVRTLREKEGTVNLNTILSELDNKVKQYGSMVTFITSKYTWRLEGNRKAAAPLALVYDLMRKGDYAAAFLHLNKRLARIYFGDREDIWDYTPLLDSFETEEDLLSQPVRAELLSGVVRTRRLHQQADQFTGRVNRGGGGNTFRQRGRGRRRGAGGQATAQPGHAGGAAVPAKEPPRV